MTDRDLDRRSGSRPRAPSHDEALRHHGPDDVCRVPAMPALVELTPERAGREDGVVDVHVVGIRIGHDGRDDSRRGRRAADRERPVSRGTERYDHWTWGTGRCQVDVGGGDGIDSPDGVCPADLTGARLEREHDGADAIRIARSGRLFGSDQDRREEGRATRRARPGGNCPWQHRQEEDQGQQQAHGSADRWERSHGLSLSLLTAWIDWACRPASRDWVGCAADGRPHCSIRRGSPPGSGGSDPGCSEDEGAPMRRSLARPHPGARAVRCCSCAPGSLRARRDRRRVDAGLRAAG